MGRVGRKFIHALIGLFLFSQVSCQTIMAREGGEWLEYAGVVNYILMVDVSKSLSKDSSDKDIVKEIVSKVFSEIYRPDVDRMHLIAFSEYPWLYEDVKDPKIMGKIINDKFDIVNRSIHDKNTNPLFGFLQLLNLIDFSKLATPNVVFFISDGEDSFSINNEETNNKESLFCSLKQYGFTIYPIYIPTAFSLKDRSCKENMKLIQGYFKKEKQLYQVDFTSDINEVIKGIKNDLKDLQLPQIKTLVDTEKMEIDFKKQMACQKNHYELRMFKLTEKNSEILQKMKEENKQLLSKNERISKNTFTPKNIWLSIIGILIIAILYFMTKRGYGSRPEKSNLWGTIIDQKGEIYNLAEKGGKRGIYNLPAPDGVLDNEKLLRIEGPKAEAFKMNSNESKMKIQYLSPVLSARVLSLSGQEAISVITKDTIKLEFRLFQASGRANKRQ